MTEINTQQTALVQYGDSAEVKSLASRIMAMHPSAKQIGDRGALLLAQLGIALGLNPLPGTGHIHAWIDNGMLCVHIGIEGRMALARKDSAFSQTTRTMNAAEVELHGLRQGDRGAVCELFRHDHTQLFAKLGLPIKPVVGIGICTANERAPKGRTLYWRATQRAIKDALRLAYSFSLPGEMLNDINLYESAPDPIIDAEFGLSDEKPADVESQHESREQVNAELFGADEPGPAAPVTEAANEHAEETAPTASPQAQPNPSSTFKDVKIKTGRWATMQIEIADALPNYQNKAGKPEPIHILNALAQQGVRQIDDNTTAAELIAELKLRQQEKAAA